MSDPIRLDIPHKLGKEGVRARLDGGVGKLGRAIPGGGNVTHRWAGDTMHFSVTGMGQTIACRATVFEERVHAEVDLPPMLALFANKVRSVFASELPKLLK